MSASFYASPTIGATTTVAVFFHEIPHEVGDFALLVQSGFSKRAAMGSQFITAIGALLGTLIGIAVQEFGGSGASAGDDPMARTAGLWGTSLVSTDRTRLFVSLNPPPVVGVVGLRIDSDFGFPDLGRYASSIHRRDLPLRRHRGRDPGAVGDGQEQGRGAQEDPRPVHGRGRWGRHYALHLLA